MPEKVVVTIALLSLADGRMVRLDGDVVTQEDALEVARSLVNTWGQLHPKAVAKVLIEVTPNHWSDCPHYEDLAEGLLAEGLAPLA